MSATSPRARPTANARRPDSLAIGQWQQQQQREAFRTALRALLMTPLMPASHADFAAVRQHAAALREWFAREAGWTLQVEHDGARLYKRAADAGDTTRGLPGYDRRRYALLCLACAVLERAEPQISLRQLGERLLTLAAEPALVERGLVFTLGTAGERRCPRRSSSTTSNTNPASPPNAPKNSKNGWRRQKSAASQTTNSSCSCTRSRSGKVRCFTMTRTGGWPTPRFLKTRQPC